MTLFRLQWMLFRVFPNNRVSATGSGSLVFLGAELVLPQPLALEAADRNIVFKTFFAAAATNQGTSITTFLGTASSVLAE